MSEKRTKAEIEQKVREFLSRCMDTNIPISEIGNDEILVDLNSLGYIKLLVSIEMEFGFEFDDEKVSYKDLRTVNNIVYYIEQNLQ